MNPATAVPCPYCSAGPGEACHSYSQWGAIWRSTPHRKRQRLADQLDPDRLEWLDGLPVATPKAISGAARGVRTVKIDCPLCGQMHSHGWAPDMDTIPTHRVAHCRWIIPPGSYWIGPTADVARRETP